MGVFGYRKRLSRTAIGEFGWNRAGDSGSNPFSSVISGKGWQLHPPENPFAGSQNPQMRIPVSPEASYTFWRCTGIMRIRSCERGCKWKLGFSAAERLSSSLY